MNRDLFNDIVKELEIKNFDKDLILHLKKEFENQDNLQYTKESLSKELDDFINSKAKEEIKKLDILTTSVKILALLNKTSSA